MFELFGTSLNGATANGDAAKLKVAVLHALMIALKVSSLSHEVFLSLVGQFGQ